MILGGFKCPYETEIRGCVVFFEFLGTSGLERLLAASHEVFETEFQPTRKIRTRGEKEIIRIKEYKGTESHKSD